MMRPFALFAICLALESIPSRAAAQDIIENVIVETYYISDASDATDVIGGGLTEGSVTYRVFIDLCDGCGLRAIYGDVNHPLSISSTAPFFNHADRGRTYGHLLNNSALSEGTTPVDSYITLGRGSTQRLSVAKALDDDGSEVGGPNNDGGSALVAQGLLVNDAAEMGIALTVADGLAQLNGQPGLPPGFIASGDDPAVAFNDATAASAFVSNDCRIACASPGVGGATPENQVLVAQLTTAGELAFLLNVEIERPDGVVVKYVATGDTLLAGETLSGMLVYPPDCGCTDPDYLEYDPAAGCDDGSCATPIVFGCLDPSACNFSVTANFNVPELCCYGINDCNGLDPYLVCPTIGLEESSSIGVSIAPNPTAGETRISGAGALGGGLVLLVRDVEGRVMRTAAPMLDRGAVTVDLEGLTAGVYLIVLRGDTGEARTRVVKQ